MYKTLYSVYVFLSQKVEIWEAHHEYGVPRKGHQTENWERLSSVCQNEATKNMKATKFNSSTVYSGSNPEPYDHRAVQFRDTIV